MSNYLPIGGNQGYVPQYLDPMAALFASKYIYEKNRAIFELCSTNLGEMPASGEDLYAHGICNCMDNYPLTRCYNDFLKAYFSYNLGYSGDALNNRKYIASILSFFPNLDPEVVNRIAFLDCDINSSEFIHCVNSILFDHWGVKDQLGFSDDEMEYLLQNTRFTDHKAGLFVENWQQLSDNQRASHIFKNMYWLSFYYRCIDKDPDNISYYYSISEMFTNINYGSQYTIVAPTITNAPNKSPQTFQITSIVISEEWEDKFFTWDYTPDYSSQSNLNHYYFVRRGGYNNWGNAVIDFVFEPSVASIFNEAFKPCP